MAATIPPLTGLVAEIMGGIATPTALMPANAEPHTFSLHPSQISALRNADVVFAVGLDLEPWLERVDGGFTIIKLAETASEPLHARNSNLTPRHEYDPHLWIDPGMMIPWERAITQTLIEQDPDNSAAYRANEIALTKTLEAAKKQLAGIGDRMNSEGIRLVATHDAYQYLEHRLGVPLAGMLADYTEVRVGARSLSKINRLTGRICIIESLDLRAPQDMLPNAPRVTIDPMGSTYAGAPGFPQRFYQGMATALLGCLSTP